MKILSRMLGETSLESFLSKYFTRLPFSSPHGAKDFVDLLSWKTVEGIMEAKQSVLRIVKDGRVIKDYVEIDHPEALNHYQQGQTLLLRYAEKSDQRLMQLAGDFADSFHTEVDIQLYCTPEGHNAFGWHFDVEEVFIIQTRGCKHYTIRPNTVYPNPLVLGLPKDQGYEKEKSDMAIEVTLEEGDWLYIPSGWWHVARTKKESMHISIGLMPRSAVDIASALPEFLAQFPFWRQRLPIHQTFPSEEAKLEFYREAFSKLAQDLTHKASTPEFLRHFLKQSKAQR